MRHKERTSRALPAHPAPPAHPKTKTRRTQQERSSETTRTLVAAASELFARRGYARTSIEDINSAAAMTRGAIYHHFEGKAELFRAVFVAKEAELTAIIARAAGAKKDAWQSFAAGCEAFLDACLDPAIQQIILKDGPAVLGWGAIREIESQFTLALIERGLEAAMRAGRIKRRPTAPLAHFLLGALSECAKGIARAPKPESTLREARAELHRLLAALARPAPSKKRSQRRGT